MNPFIETKNLFTSYLNYTEPLTFDQWLATPDDYKAAVLYLQFFDPITLAWYKADSLQRGCPEDGVSTVLQYLQKNVPIIVAAPKKFTPNYIYRVAYNCLYCICHDIQRDKDRFQYEISNIVISGDSELDLCDMVPTYDEDHSVSAARAKIWEIVAELGPTAEFVVSELLDDREITRKRRTTLSCTEVRNIRSNFEVYREQVLSQLRERLGKYQDVFYN